MRAILFNTYRLIVKRNQPNIVIYLNTYQVLMKLSLPSRCREERLQLLKRVKRITLSLWERLAERNQKRKTKLKLSLRKNLNRVLVMLSDVSQLNKSQQREVLNSRSNLLMMKLWIFWIKELNSMGLMIATEKKNYSFIFLSQHCYEFKQHSIVFCFVVSFHQIVFPRFVFNLLKYRFGVNIKGHNTLFHINCFETRKIF